MRLSFREFVRSRPIRIRMREEEAAPSSGGSPSQPSSPGKTNKFHFDSLQRGLGIGDEEMQSALEQGNITVYNTYDYYSKWGFLVVGPTTAVVEKNDDGTFAVTFQLQQKQLMEPKSFIRAYEKGQRPIYYQGPVEDKTENMTEEELQDAMAKPLENGGAQPGGGGMGAPGGGGMGAPPMGGGAPPAGGPPGGMGGM